MRNVKSGQGGRTSQSDDQIYQLLKPFVNEVQSDFAVLVCVPIAKTFCKSRNSKNTGAICFRRSYVEPRKYLINLT